MGAKPFGLFEEPRKVPYTNEFEADSLEDAWKLNGLAWLCPEMYEMTALMKPKGPTGSDTWPIRFVLISRFIPPRSYNYEKRSELTIIATTPKQCRILH